MKMARKLWIGTQPDVSARTVIIEISEKDYQRTLRKDRSDPVENAKVHRVKNLLTGKMVKIRHTSCGLDCYCAMEFVH
jgi:hypothetical protein